MCDSYFSEWNEVSVGDQIPIEICLGMSDGPTWDRDCEVIAAWKTRKDHQLAVVRVLPSLEDDQDNDGAVWTDCLFVAGACPGCGNHWITLSPASELTSERIQEVREAF
jgi:hypothetical protein